MERNQRRTTAQRVAGSFAAVNVGIGALGSFGTAVRNDRDGLVNTAPGYLLGIAGTNGAHALVHLGVGAAGLAARRSERASVAYLRGVAVAFGLMAATGARKVRGREGLHDVKGMTVGRQSNWIHMAWAAIGATYSRGLGAEGGPLAGRGRSDERALPISDERDAVPHGRGAPAGER